MTTNEPFSALAAEIQRISEQGAAFQRALERSGLLEQLARQAKVVEAFQWAVAAQFNELGEGAARWPLSS